MDDFQVMVQAFQTVGLWAIFAWLYVDERRQHNKTREDMTKRVREVIDNHMEDLREVAGMRTNLNRVAGLVQQSQSSPQSG